VWKRRSLRYHDGRVESAAGDRPTTRRIVILVHGFNNDWAEASKNYRDFAQQLDSVAGGRLISHDWAQVWKLFWPGYVVRPLSPVHEERPDVLPHLHDPADEEKHFVQSAFSYSRQVKKAPDVGAALADFLDAHGALEVVFVAHSLGCRVVLEALRALKAKGHDLRVRLKGTCLMAAAVPTYMVADVSTGSIGTMIRDSPSMRVLYSGRDTVLRWAFPPGQWLANEGARTEAVGLRGGPRGAWRARDDSGLRHGHYWSHASTAPHGLRLMGLAPAVRDHLSGMSEFAPIARSLPMSAGPLVNRLPARSLRTTTPLDDF